MMVLELDAPSLSQTLKTLSLLLCLCDTIMVVLLELYEVWGYGIIRIRSREMTEFNYSVNVCENLSNI